MYVCMYVFRMGCWDWKSLITSWLQVYSFSFLTPTVCVYMHVHSLHHLWMPCSTNRPVQGRLMILLFQRFEMCAPSLLLPYPFCALSLCLSSLA